MTSRAIRPLPNAVARASNGDTIQIRAGRYTPRAYQDVPFRDLVVRSFVIIDGKNLALVGEKGVVLGGNDKLPMSAIVVRNADVSMSHLEITGFNYAIEEDKIYDGHGIFVIDSKARIDDVTISKFQKMGLTGRGDTQLDVSNLRVLDGHVGVWLHETAYLRLRNALVRGNDSSAITAYDNSVAHRSTVKATLGACVITHITNQKNSALTAFIVRPTKSQQATERGESQFAVIQHGRIDRKQARRQWGGKVLALAVSWQGSIAEFSELDLSCSGRQFRVLLGDGRAEPVTELLDHARLPAIGTGDEMIDARPA